MKIRRFVADDMQQALSQVKHTFGKDALILQTRKYRRGGFLGFFGREMVEVTAAVADDDEMNGRTAPFSKEPVKRAVEPVERASLYRNYPAKDEVDDDLDVKEELRDIKLILGKMLSDLETTGAEESGTYPGPFQQIYRQLRANEVEERLARRIINEAMERLHPSSWGEEAALSVVEESIAKRLLRPRPIAFNKENEKKRVVLVGPTGVGKTTTIAKLAAIFSILEKKKVALATVDTYRVAAVDQLQTYADIIALPLEVTYSPKELQQALAKHDDKDLVLIDTAGRSPLDEMAMTELKAFLDPCPKLDIFLVVGANTKQADLLETIKRFSDLPVKQLIFTKLDETQRHGVILNVVNRMRKGLAYVTTGQRVPDDIAVPDPLQLARLIMKVSDLERPGRKVKIPGQNPTGSSPQPGF